MQIYCLEPVVLSSILHIVFRKTDGIMKSLKEHSIELDEPSMDEMTKDVKKSMKHRSLISVFDTKSGLASSEIDIAILKALFKSRGAENGEKADATCT